MVLKSELGENSRMLALSYGRNGLFINALEHSEDKGYVTKHWHTSYPWKDFLFPYWYKGGGWQEALLNEANQQLAFEYFPSNIPAVADKYIVHTTEQENPFYRQFKQNFPSLLFTEGKQAEISKLFAPILELHAEKVVFVELNFMSFRVVEFSPKAFGTQVKWEYKQAEVKFSNINELLARVLKLGYLDFITTTTPSTKLHNLLANYLFYMPATTSDLDVIDFYRAIYFDLVAEITDKIDIPTVSGGIMIVTGELLSFLQNKVSIMLLVLDILGIKGTWACHFDDKMRVLPWLYANLYGYSIPTEILFNTWDLIYTPVKKLDKQVPTIFVDKTKYLGLQDEIHRFELGSQVTSFEAEHEYQLLFHHKIHVNTLTIDLRKRPVKYGRKILDNRRNIKKWLASLANIDKT